MSRNLFMRMHAQRAFLGRGRRPPRAACLLWLRAPLAPDVLAQWLTAGTL